MPEGLRLGVTRLALVALAYYASARVGLQLALVDDIVTPLWPPTGVAVVAAFGLGYGIWPAIAVAAFAVNAPIADSSLAALAIAVGNTSAPLIAVSLLRRLDFDERLARLRDAVTLVFVALTTMTVSASVGTIAVKASGAPVTVPDTWWVWWAGDAMGVLIVAPVLWCAMRFSSEKVDWRRAPEAAGLFVLVAAAAYAAPRSALSTLFIVLPAVGWAAWRFRQPGAAPAGLLASTVVILAAADNVGVFADETLLARMAVLQAFNASVALTSFVFAAAVTERQEMLESLYEREHRIALDLQRSFLPERLPDVPGIVVAARYQPARRESEVGGDWYDVMAFANDKLGLAVGDVAGHGIASAAAMAQLRTGLRARALDRRGPVATLAALNQLAIDLHPGTLATVLYAEFDPDNSVVRIANAGHPRPLLITPSGDAEYLDTGTAVPIGVSRDFSCEETEHSLPEGATLVLFTDGLVERREASIDRGLETLRVASSRPVDDIEELCDRLILEVAGPIDFDDIALLVVQPTSLRDERLRLERPAIPSAVAEVRHVLRRWLRANDATEDEVDDILLAATEAQTNAVRHAYRGPDGVVVIDASIDAGEVSVRVRDHGRWKNAQVTDGNSGRGLPLIRQLANSEVRIESDGTEVRMTRRLSYGPNSG